MSSFQAAASRFGAEYEDHVGDWLEGHGFVVTGRRVRHDSGVEFDIVAEDPYGQPLGVECKASPDDATQPGMVRSDNRWKVLGYLYALRLWRDRTGERHRYALITSHMPPPGSAQRDLLDLAEAVGDLQVIEVPNPRDGRS